MHASQLQNPPIGARGTRRTLSPASSNGTTETRRPSSAPSSGTNKTVRLLLVDDHPVVRKGLHSCLSQFEQITVVGEASDGEDALRKARELSPDVVLMDIDMPRMNGLTATELLCKENPNIKVLILSMHSDSDYVMRILRSGAKGYALKQAPTDELMKAIETVSAGETCFSSDVARIALNQFIHGSGEGPNPDQVSSREREVLIAIAEGLSNKEIACRLGVGVRTIETHRERIMRKLNIHSVAGLTKFAISKGLLPLQRGCEVTP
jgi:two-component system, NarL family, nitrate/nitrite response regulator NarL